jgi:hypothetical protein
LDSQCWMEILAGHILNACQGCCCLNWLDHSVFWHFVWYVWIFILCICFVLLYYITLFLAYASRTECMACWMHVPNPVVEM